MSKMPKKKSCFQITSVTQAQVAASSITDDTESLDDPDESRTEDVSSEIFDVSRTELGVCDRSSSDETLNNVGESQEGRPPTAAPVNGGLSYKSVGPGRVTPRTSGGSVPSSATHPPTGSSTVSPSVAHTAPPVSTGCGSRFRVIKLDHGIGEPFRRGRWTCTEFYDKDSDSNRTADGVRPAVTHNHSIDRDSGLGTASNSVVTSVAFSAQASENPADGGYCLAQPTELQPQGYSVAPQIGSGASAFQSTGYTNTASQQAQFNMQPVAPQNLLSLNGAHQGAMQQKSPSMAQATQPQHFAYSTHPAGLSAGQPDYREQHFGSSTQNLSLTTLPAVPPASQVASSLIAPAGPGVQGLSGEAAPAPVACIHPGSGQQHPVSQTQPSAGMGNAPAPSLTTTTTSHSSVQSSPATVPSTTNTPPGVPSQAPGTGGLAQPQGAHGGATTGLPSGFINKAEDGRQKSDGPPLTSVRLVPGKDGVKPFISDTLGLPTPAVNSLFGIHITMDVDDDSQLRLDRINLLFFPPPPPMSYSTMIRLLQGNGRTDVRQFDQCSCNMAQGVHFINVIPEENTCEHHINFVVSRDIICAIEIIFHITDPGYICVSSPTTPALIVGQASHGKFYIYCGDNLATDMNLKSSMYLSDC
ncbi:hypothetical protein F2P81_005570 [Scophthalmus maximus]|uniref:TSC22 domain family protein 2-like n=1 Tax=Scophthalmus maximus TaxID=52904 RepID=A0A6A4TCB1_SCOMX|nr:hypothetical protein F2P81_005570 [Scophthalmus maximus]